MADDPERSFENDFVDQGHTILWQKGYSISKEHTSPSRLALIRKDLRAQPLQIPNFPARPSFRVYQETSNWIRVPRHWGIQNYGEPDIDLLQTHQISELPWNGKLRNDQLDPFNATIKHLHDKKTGILSLPTGKGKTFIAIAVLAKMSVRTMICVHTTHLLHQWKKELEQAFGSECSIGIVQGTKSQKELDAKHDIVICMIQTLLNIVNIPTIFGMLVIDEVHHLSSMVFNTIMFQAQSKYVLGLSATPKRKDGLTNVLTWHLGELFYNESARLSDKQGVVHVYRFPGPHVQSEFHAHKITALVENHARTAKIIEVLLDLVEKDHKNVRKILVLTERREHASKIKNELEKRQSKKSVALFLGGSKNNDMEAKKDLLVATFALFSEGISIPHLNTLVLATPKSDIVQCLGRIFRQKHDQPAMILDFVDDLFLNQYGTRRKTYKTQLSQVEFDDHGYIL